MNCLYPSPTAHLKLPLIIILVPLLELWPGAPLACRLIPAVPKLTSIPVQFAAAVKGICPPRRQCRLSCDHFVGHLVRNESSHRVQKSGPLIVYESVALTRLVSALYTTSGMPITLATEEFSCRGFNGHLDASSTKTMSFCRSLQAVRRRFHHVIS
jgi:hypothetical protein